MAGGRVDGRHAEEERFVSNVPRAGIGQERREVWRQVQTEITEDASIQHNTHHRRFSMISANRKERCSVLRKMLFAEAETMTI